MLEAERLGPTRNGSWTPALGTADTALWGRAWAPPGLPSSAAGWTPMDLDKAPVVLQQSQLAWGDREPSGICADGEGPRSPFSFLKHRSDLKVEFAVFSAFTLRGPSLSGGWGPPTEGEGDGASNL